MLEIKGTQVRALPHEERTEHRRPRPRACRSPRSSSAPEAAAASRTSRTTRGYLIHLPREGWVWYFRAVSGSTGYPRVRARDGRVYPYR